MKFAVAALDAALSTCNLGTATDPDAVGDEDEQRLRDTRGAEAASTALSARGARQDVRSLP